MATTKTTKTSETETERWNAAATEEKQHAGIAAAMVAAQAEIEAPKKNRTGQVGSRAYDYADLGSVLDAVLPVLNKHGIAVVQTIEGQEAGGVVLKTDLIHAASREAVHSLYPLPDQCTPQEMGSAITYGRRYSLICMTGVVGEDDDDAASVEASGKKHSKAPPAERPMDAADAARFVADALMDKAGATCHDFVAAGGTRAELVDLVYSVLGPGDEFTKDDLRSVYKLTLDRMKHTVADRHLADQEPAP